MLSDQCSLTDCCISLTTKVNLFQWQCVCVCVCVCVGPEKETSRFQMNSVAVQQGETCLQRQPACIKDMGPVIWSACMSWICKPKYFQIRLASEKFCVIWFLKVKKNQTLSFQRQKTKKLAIVVEKSIDYNADRSIPVGLKASLQGFIYLRSGHRCVARWYMLRQSGKKLAWQAHNRVRGSWLPTRDTLSTF